jgi:hypothetical protein
MEELNEEIKETSLECNNNILSIATQMLKQMRLVEAILQ